MSLFKNIEFTSPPCVLPKFEEQPNLYIGYIKAGTNYVPLIFKSYEADLSMTLKGFMQYKKLSTAYLIKLKRRNFVKNCSVHQYDYNKALTYKGEFPISYPTHSYDLPESYEFVLKYDNMDHQLQILRDELELPKNPLIWALITAYGFIAAIPNYYPIISIRTKSININIYSKTNEITI